MSEMTISNALVHQVLPIFALVVLLGVVWLKVCRLIVRRAEHRHQLAMRMPEVFDDAALTTRISALALARTRASRGGPVDRLFIGGLTVAALLTISYLVLWTVGYVPANSNERAFISMLSDSPFSKQPEVAASLSAASSAVVVTRQHFFAAEAAYTKVSLSLSAHSK